MLGISTCWWENKQYTGSMIIDDILELGLRGVELEYRITLSVYEEMKSRLKEDIKVLSLHNYFPRPAERMDKYPSGDLFLLSSEDASERDDAIKHTMTTIEYAERLGASCIVLHLGYVDLPFFVDDFRKIRDQGKDNKAKLMGLIDRHKSDRIKKGLKQLDSLFLSLEKLNREAVKRNVFLCIENRYYFSEMPSFDEIGAIIQEFHGGMIRYWHDTGHGTVQENLGICPQKDLLEAYADHMAGIHLHDVKWLEDHLAPGQGNVDFNMIKSYLKPSTLKILELDGKRVNRDGLIRGIEFCEKYF